MQLFYSSPANTNRPSRLILFFCRLPPANVTIGDAHPQDIAPPAHLPVAGSAPDAGQRSSLHDPRYFPSRHPLHEKVVSGPRPSSATETGRDVTAACVTPAIAETAVPASGPPTVSSTGNGLSSSGAFASIVPPGAAGQPPPEPTCSGGRLTAPPFCAPARHRPTTPHVPRRVPAADAFTPAGPQRAEPVAAPGTVPSLADGGSPNADWCHASGIRTAADIDARRPGGRGSGTFVQRFPCGQSVF